MIKSSPDIRLAAVSEAYRQSFQTGNWGSLADFGIHSAYISRYGSLGLLLRDDSYITVIPISSGTEYGRPATERSGDQVDYHPQAITDRNDIMTALLSLGIDSGQLRPTFVQIDVSSRPYDRRILERGQEAFGDDRYQQRDLVLPADVREGFIGEIERRRLPINLVDAEDFFDFVTRFRPPRGFFTRLLESIQYKDNETFERDFMLFGRQILDVMKKAGMTYTAVYYKATSGLWIRQKLCRQLGLPEPAREYYDDADPGLDMTSMLRINRGSSPDERITGLVLHVDDFSLSGANLTGAIQLVPDTAQKQLVVGTVYVSQSAKNIVNRYRRKGITPVFGQTLKPSGDTMTLADFQLLLALCKGNTADEDRMRINPHDPVFFTYYKVPDNMFWPLSNGANPLIWPSEFRQPYR